MDEFDSLVNEGLEEAQDLIRYKYNQAVEIMEKEEQRFKIYALGFLLTLKIDDNGRIKIFGNELSRQELENGLLNLAENFLDKLTGDFAFDFHSKVAKKALDNLFRLEKALGLKVSKNYLEENEWELIRPYVAGYISNVRGVSFNDTRHLIEDLSNAIWQEMTLENAKKVVDAWKIRRMIFKLSTTTHPLASYRQVIYQIAKENDITHFRLDVPNSRLPFLALTGYIAKQLYMIRTVDEWDKLGLTSSRVINGMGLHHNSDEFYTPIPDEILSREFGKSKKKRKKVRKILGKKRS